MDKAVQVEFCSSQEVERHRAFFRSQGEEETGEPISPPRAGESWDKVAEWDASHQVPKTGDGRKVNPPTLVAWSPKGDFLFTSCDAFGLTAWDVGALGWDPSPRKNGEDVDAAAYGYPLRFFVAQRGNSVHVLQETHSYQHAYYSIHDGAARPVCRGANQMLWGYGSSATVDRALNRTKGIGPWRPGTDREIALVRDYSSLKIVDVTTLPDRPAVDKGLLFELLAWVTGRPPTAGRPTKVPAHEAPALQWIAFDSLGARDKTIFGFHFHPSGQYVAVTTGDWDDKLRRAVHLVHVDSARIVASVPTPAEALGWSPGGRFLLVRRGADKGKDGPARAGIWDGLRFEEVSVPSDDILSQPWALKALASGGESVVSADGQRCLSSSGAVVASVVREGLQICPGEELAEVASTTFAHAAWHPTDPHCFVTVGGGGSEEYPETYTRDQDRPHGRLLRIWRLTS